MTRAEIAEASNILVNVLDLLLSTMSGNFGSAQVEARHDMGYLRANAEKSVTSASVGKQLYKCFELARKGGATRIQFDGIRKAMIALRPETIPATAIAVGSIYFSLIEQSRLIAAMNFTSREDVDKLLDTMNAAFDPAEEFAADATDDPSVFQALNALHSAVSQDLVARARPLPQVVTFKFSQRMPSLALANRIYGDASRADELRLENKCVHPAFVREFGRCLSF